MPTYDQAELERGCIMIAKRVEGVCRLVDGKITYVHRRLWPALVRLAGRFPRVRLAAVTEVHTAAGRHEIRLTQFPQWVPKRVLAAANQMTEQEAISRLSVVGALLN